MSAVFFAHNYRFQTMEAEVFNADISNLCDSIRKRLRDYLSYNNAINIRLDEFKIMLQIKEAIKTR